MEENILYKELYLKMQKEYEKKEKEYKERIIKLEVDKTNLENKVFNQQLHINTLNKMLFGPKKESIKDDSVENGKQCTLFDENNTEEFEEAVEKEVDEIVVYRRKRKNDKTKAGIKRNALKDAEKVIIEHRISSEDAFCDRCGAELQIIGKEIVRKEIEVVPAKIIINVHVRYKYKCKKCGTEDSEYEKPHFVEPAIPRAILPGSFLSPSLASEVIYDKYYKGVPLARQSQIWDDKGLVLPRNMLANWCIKLKEYYLEPIYNLMLKEIKNSSEVIHIDETTTQCNKEAGRKASSNSYMWVLASGSNEEKKGVIFTYNKSRATDVAKKILKGYEGIMITDGYTVYDKIENVTHAECWAHCRRYYLDSVPLNSKKKPIKTAAGYRGVELIDELFKIERSIKGLSDEEKLKVRSEKSAPIVKEFYDWVYLLSKKIIVNEKLQKAVTYAINQKKELCEFLFDARIPLSNAIAEVSVRPFAIREKELALFGHATRCRNECRYVFYCRISKKK